MICHSKHQTLAHWRLCFLHLSFTLLQVVEVILAQSTVELAEVTEQLVDLVGAVLVINVVLNKIGN